LNAQLFTGNASGLSNLNASNLAFGIVSSSLILGNTLSNIQASNIVGFQTGNALSNINASNLAFGVINSALILGNTISNINASNVTGTVGAAYVAGSVSNPSQPNITSVGTSRP
jgi:2-iminoacetate synthase ThiH